jgi:hypothetical protein
MRDELSPRVGHMLADRLREAAKIIEAEDNVWPEGS